MEQVMVIVNELYELLINKNSAADALATKLATQAKEQEVTTTAQAEKDTELNGRETEVAKVEDILTVKKNNQEMLSKIREQNESLANAIAANNEQTAKTKSEIDIAQKGVNDDFATVRKEQAKLAEDQKQLAEDRKTYKEEIVKKIAGGIKV